MTCQCPGFSCAFPMVVPSPCVPSPSSVSSHRLTDRPQHYRSKSPSLFVVQHASSGCNSHLFAQLDLELPGSQESQQSEGVESLLVPLGLEHGAQLVDSGILLLGSVTWVARLCDRGNSGEVEMTVVLGIEVLSGGHGCGVCWCCRDRGERVASINKLMRPWRG
jgi:hypothetical protein